MPQNPLLFTPANPWNNQPGSVAIFGGPPVPTPLPSRNGLTIGDTFKVSGVYNFGEVWPTNSFQDCAATLQSFLLYCQQMALAMNYNVWDTLEYRDRVICYLPRGFYYVSSTIIVPEYVEFMVDGLLVRTPYLNRGEPNQSNGMFYATSPSQEGVYLPTVIVVPKAHLGTININVNGDTGSDYFRGSGVVVGRFWATAANASATIGNAGSGYVVGDYVYAGNPSVFPYIPCRIRVTGINSSGGITSAVTDNGTRTTYNDFGGGAYALPPALQIQQWTTSNGFPQIFDSARPGYFIQAATYHADGSTGAGTGASFLPQWLPDFIGGSYNFGASGQASALSTSTQIDKINIVGNIQASFSSTYGQSYGVLFLGLNGFCNEIELLGGSVGVLFLYCNDYRFNTINVVESGIGLALYGAGSIKINSTVLDTCGCAVTVDTSVLVDIRGYVFFEQNNLGGPVFPNTQGNAVQLGLLSSANNPNRQITIDLKLINMGGVPQSTLNAFPNLAELGVQVSVMTASLAMQYCKATRVRLDISNWDELGVNFTYLPTNGFVSFGPGIDSSCLIEGQIDQIAGPAVIGNVSSTAADVRIWDAAGGEFVASNWPGGRAGPFGTYEIWTNGAPASGTTGVGAGKCGVGSICHDLANGTVYRNTGTLASPTWTTP